MLSQNLFNSGNRTESSFVFWNDLFNLLEFKVIYITDQCFVVPGNNTRGVDDSTCLIQIFFYFFYNFIRIFGDDRYLFKSFKVVSEMVNDRSGDDINQQTQHGRIAVNTDKNCNIYNNIKTNQYVRNTVIFSGFIINFIYNNICNLFIFKCYLFTYDVFFYLIFWGITFCISAY